MYIPKDYNEMRKKLLEQATQFIANTGQNPSTIIDSKFSGYVETMAYLYTATNYQVDYGMIEGSILTALDKRDVVLQAQAMGYNYAKASPSKGDVSLYVDYTKLINYTTDPGVLGVSKIHCTLFVKKTTNFYTKEKTIYTPTHDYEFDFINGTIDVYVDGEVVSNPNAYFYIDITTKRFVITVELQQVYSKEIFLNPDDFKEISFYNQYRYDSTQYIYYAELYYKTASIGNFILMQTVENIYDLEKNLDKFSQLLYLKSVDLFIHINTTSYLETDKYKMIVYFTDGAKGTATVNSIQKCDAMIMREYLDSNTNPPGTVYKDRSYFPSSITHPTFKTAGVNDEDMESIRQNAINYKLLGEQIITRSDAFKIKSIIKDDRMIGASPVLRTVSMFSFNYLTYFLSIQDEHFVDSNFESNIQDKMAGFVAPFYIDYAYFTIKLAIPDIEPIFVTQTTDGISTPLVDNSSFNISLNRKSILRFWYKLIDDSQSGTPTFLANWETFRDKEFNLPYVADDYSSTELRYNDVFRNLIISYAKEISHPLDALVVSTTDINLSNDWSAISGGLYIDGVLITINNRVLLTGQTNKNTNGVWITKKEYFINLTSSPSANIIIPKNNIDINSNNVGVTIELSNSSTYTIQNGDVLSLINQTDVNENGLWQAYNTIQTYWRRAWDCEINSFIYGMIVNVISGDTKKDFFYALYYANFNLPTPSGGREYIFVEFPNGALIEKENYIPYNIYINSFIFSEIDYGIISNTYGAQIDLSSVYMPIFAMPYYDGQDKLTDVSIMFKFPVLKRWYYEKVVDNYKGNTAGVTPSIDEKYQELERYVGTYLIYVLSTISQSISDSSLISIDNKKTVGLIKTAGYSESLKYNTANSTPIFQYVDNLPYNTLFPAGSGETPTNATIKAFDIKKYRLTVRPIVNVFSKNTVATLAYIYPMLVSISKETFVSNNGKIIINSMLYILKNISTVDYVTIDSPDYIIDFASSDFIRLVGNFYLHNYYIDSNGIYQPLCIGRGYGYKYVRAELRNELIMFIPENVTFDVKYMLYGKSNESSSLNINDYSIE
jgi:hypothetical protein